MKIEGDTMSEQAHIPDHDNNVVKTAVVVSALMATALAAVLSVQKLGETPVDNSTSMEIAQVDVPNNFLVAAARYISGNPTTVINPGSVEDVIKVTAEMRGYPYLDKDPVVAQKTIDAGVTYAISTNPELSQYATEDLPDGTWQIPIESPDIGFFGDTQEPFLYRDQPEDFPASMTDEDGARDAELQSAYFEANAVGIWENNMNNPPDGWYPVGISDLSSWAYQMPGITTTQVNRTTAQAAELLVPPTE